MKTKDKQFSKFGKEGVKVRTEKFQVKRNELFKELSKYIDKTALDYIQLSKVRWSNDMLQALINNYKNHKNG